MVENQLYQFTPLQSTISIMNIALVNRQPRTMSIKELLQHYIDHRIDVIERRTRHLLHEAKKRAHVLEGMIYAVCDIDEVIKLIRSSKTREEAIQKLMARRFRIPADHPFAPQIPERLLKIASSQRGVAMTRVQAEAIGSMRLIQLVGLEIEKITADYRKVVAEIEDYEAILADRERVLTIIKDDVAQMRERYDRPRRTSIEESADDIDFADLIQEHSVAVTISHEGYVKRNPLDTYKAQGRGGRGIQGGKLAKDEDFLEHLFIASTHDDLLCFTDSGRVFKMKVYEIPELSRTSKGRSIVNLIDLKPGEKCVAYLPISDFEKGEDFLVFATAQAKVKRSSLKLYQNVNRSGLIAINLNDGDELVGVACTSGHDHLLLGTANGMSIRFEEDDARAMGRSSAGVKGIDLADGDEVVGLVKIQMNDSGEATDSVRGDVDLLTVTENGYGKRTDLNEYLVASEQEDGSVEYRTQSRAGKGRRDIKTTARNGKVVCVKAVIDNEDIVFVTRNGMIVRTQSEEIRRIGRNTAGVRLVNIKAGDRVVSAAVTPRDEEESE
ncbi:DNA gyrase C-terminal beta-propeller domain-containing protein [Phycisphaerales bacterium ac7]